MNLDTINNDRDKDYTSLLHLSVLLFLLIPFGNLIVPFFLWMSKKNESAIIDQMGRNILNYQLAWSIITIVFLSGFFFFKILHWPGASIFAIISIIFLVLNIVTPIIFAIYSTKKDHLYRYPTLIIFF